MMIVKKICKFEGRTFRSEPRTYKEPPKPTFPVIDEGLPSYKGGFSGPDFYDDETAPPSIIKTRPATKPKETVKEKPKEEKKSKAEPKKKTAPKVDADGTPLAEEDEDFDWETDDEDGPDYNPSTNTKYRHLKLRNAKRSNANYKPKKSTASRKSTTKPKTLKRK